VSVNRLRSVVALDMQRHFAVAVHNYHFVLADTPVAAGCW